MGRLVASIALAAVLALTGCGGDGDDEAAPPPTTSPPPPTTVSALVGNDQAGTPFCQLARTYTEKFSGVLAAASDPVKLRAASTDAEAAVRQAQSTAPAEIRGDVTRVATTAREVLAALQKNDFDLSRTPEAVAKLQEPQFQTALGNVNRYGRAHCGIN